jgi:imidazole glycerol-phosphate synthase subunit HisH
MSSPMNVAIIDYGSGNLHSAAKAFERAARDNAVNAAIQVTSDPELVRGANRIVLPGVGAFKDCRDGLRAIPGMWEVLQDEVMRRSKPFLGICVGMQLMASRGLEYDVSEGFGWIPGDVMPIEPSDPSYKIPHMGWNTLTLKREHRLLDGIELGDNGLHAYFVHSFHLMPSNPGDILATTVHGATVTAMVGRDNMAGTQFHPEKSQALGLALIANFLRWRP